MKTEDSGALEIAAKLPTSGFTVLNVSYNSYTYYCKADYTSEHAIFYIQLSCNFNFVGENKTPNFTLGLQSECLSVRSSLHNFRLSMRITN